MSQSTCFQRKGLRITDLRYVCPNCVEQVRDEYKVTCLICDSRFFPFGNIRSRKLCGKCASEENMRELDRVEAHNTRARQLDRPATLTIKQWLAALRYFDERCAYCLSHYKGLEHYLPLDLGGGTTALNCLPSCMTCNVRKRDKHPDEFALLFPAENIEHIKSYMRSVSCMI